MVNLYKDIIFESKLAHKIYITTFVVLKLYLWRQNN